MSKISVSDSPVSDNPIIRDFVNTIPKGLSIYLDLIRFLAAVSVVLFHTWDDFFPDFPVKWPGHEAVVVFFVLSGYVIAHAAARPGVTLSVYVQHRIARIVPVAWAALLLACIILAGDEGNLVASTLTNAVFMGQSGFWAVAAPINPPFWSLNYEVWYYVIFAAWMYTPRRYRYLATIVAMLVAGVKILLLFPVWLMGVLLYKKMPALDTNAAKALVLITMIAAGLLYWFDVSDSLRRWLYEVFPPAWRFHYSSQFLYDILLGIIVTVHFAAIASLGQRSNVLERVEIPIRYLAGFTFSLYVFHEPLRSLISPQDNPLFFYGQLAFYVFLLANVTEKRVHFFRKILRRNVLPASLPI